MQEAQQCHVPTIGIIDTDQYPGCVTYPIPGNDDSPEAIELYTTLFAKAINRGKEVYFERQRQEATN